MSCNKFWFRTKIKIEFINCRNPINMTKKYLLSDSGIKKATFDIRREIAFLPTPRISKTQANIIFNP